VLHHAKVEVDNQNTWLSRADVWLHYAKIEADNRSHHELRPCLDLRIHDHRWKHFDYLQYSSFLVMVERSSILPFNSSLRILSIRN